MLGDVLEPLDHATFTNTESSFDSDSDGTVFFVLNLRRQGVTH